MKYCCKIYTAMMVYSYLMIFGEKDFKWKDLICPDCKAKKKGRKPKLSPPKKNGVKLS